MSTDLPQVTPNCLKWLVEQKGWRELSSDLDNYVLDSEGQKELVTIPRMGELVSPLVIMVTLRKINMSDAEFMSTASNFPDHLNFPQV